MSSRGDREYTLLRAQQPVAEISATGDVWAQGKQGLATVLRLVAGAAEAATAVFRTGGSGGTVVWTLSAPAGWTDETPFPAGLRFSDGFHVTLTGADAAVNAVGVADDS